MKPIVAISILIVVATTAFYFSFKNYFGFNNLMNDQPPTQNELNNDNISSPTLDKSGVVEGSLSFPSEYIPTDLTVCAETESGNKVNCSTEQIKDTRFTNGVGYSLMLPVGDYYIYSVSDSFNPNYKAYYNEFVECGLSVNCSSHNNILVNVSEDETVTNIDPIDWYNQNPATDEPTPYI